MQPSNPEQKGEKCWRTDDGVGKGGTTNGDSPVYGSRNVEGTD